MAMTASTVSHEELTELLDYCAKTGVWRWRVFRGRLARPGSIAGSYDTCGYRQIKINGRCYSAHRLAWLYVYGRMPGEELDHIDGNRANNSISNLRECSHAQNQINTRLKSNNASGYRGVGWMTKQGKWRARITVDGKQIFLGLFDDPQEAHEAYCRAAKEHYGEFAKSKQEPMG